MEELTPRFNEETGKESEVEHRENHSLTKMTNFYKTKISPIAPCRSFKNLIKPYPIGKVNIESDLKSRSRAYLNFRIAKSIPKKINYWDSAFSHISKNEHHSMISPNFEILSYNYRKKVNYNMVKSKSTLKLAPLNTSITPSPDKKTAFLL